MLVVTMRVLVWSRSMMVMPTMVFPAPQGRTMVPKPDPGPLLPTNASAAACWYCRGAKGLPERVVFRSMISSGSPSTRGTSSFTGQPSFSSSCFTVPRRVRGSRKR